MGIGGGKPGSRLTTIGTGPGAGLKADEGPPDVGGLYDGPFELDGPGSTLGLTSGGGRWEGPAVAFGR